MEAVVLLGMFHERGSVFNWNANQRIMGAYPIKGL